MSRRLLVAALAAVLVAPVALAATPIRLTIYHSDDTALYAGNTRDNALDTGFALVHARRALDISAGRGSVHINGLPANVDPETFTAAFEHGAGVQVLATRVHVAHPEADAIGHTVDIEGATTSGSGSRTQYHGKLLGWGYNGVMVQAPDGRIQLVHDYASMTMPTDAAMGRGSATLDVDAKAAGQREATITYATKGLGWRMAYSATLPGSGACRMLLKSDASIANRSGRDFAGAGVTLVAGQPNLAQHGVRMVSMAARAMPMAASEPMPVQSALGDYRSYTLPGTPDLPNGTVTLVPLYAAQTIACQREYIIDDGGAGYPPRPNTNDYGSRDYKDRTVASTLVFTAPDTLPAGTLRAWTHAADGSLALLGESSIADSLKGQRVSVQLGQSFDLRASRERTRFKVDASAHTMSEAYHVSVTNGGDSARTVTLRVHPDRWREWTLASSSSKPVQQTTQLLEFKLPVPAHGAATLDYAIDYTWTAKDL